MLVFETLLASLLFTAAVFIAKPVFLTTLQTEPEAPLTTSDLLASLRHDVVVGYTPDEQPYATIMNRAANLLQICKERKIGLFSLDSVK